MSTRKETLLDHQKVLTIRVNVKSRWNRIIGACCGIRSGSFRERSHRQNIDTDNVRWKDRLSRLFTIGCYSQQRQWKHLGKSTREKTGKEISRAYKALRRGRGGRRQVTVISTWKLLDLAFFFLLLLSYRSSSVLLGLFCFSLLLSFSHFLLFIFVLLLLSSSFLRGLLARS